LQSRFFEWSQVLPSLLDEFTDDKRSLNKLRRKSKLTCIGDISNNIRSGSRHPYYNIYSNDGISDPTGKEEKVAKFPKQHYFYDRKKRVFLSLFVENVLLEQMNSAKSSIALNFRNHAQSSFH